MLQLIINEKGGPSRTESFDKNEVTIGRVQGNDIILPKGNISKRHSRIVMKDGKFIIVDLKSTNGTYVNGKKITAPQVIKETDKVYIGDFTLQIEREAAGLAIEDEPLAPRGRGASEAGEEIDLFGEQASMDRHADPAPAAPSLIDENFDQEFEAPAAEPEPQSRLPQPSRRASIRPEPSPPELELDEEFGAGDGMAPAVEIDNSAFAAPEPVMDPPVPLDPEPVPLEDPPALDPISAFEETPPPSQDGAPTATPASAPVPLTPPTPAPPHIAVADPGALPQPVAFTAPPPVAVAAPAEPMTHEELAGEIHHGLLEALDLPGVPVDAVPGFREAARGWAAARAASLRPHFPAGLDESELVDEAVERAVGLDEISSLLADDAVFEIVVTPEREVLVDRDGRLASAEIRYETERGVVRAVRCLAGLGGLDVRAPMSMVDARLRNGARLLATLPPLAFRGPSLSVRKTTRDFFTFEKLREYDTLGENVIRFLDLALRFRRNLLLSVGPGVTGTATLNALLSHVPSDERVVTAERGVELHLRGHVHAVGFNLTNGVALRDVLDYATAAQTERVLIGELSEEELSDVVQAFSTSIDGGAAVVAGVSVEDSVARLQTWLNGAPPDLLARAFPVVLQERKLSDASRRVTEVSELVFEGGSLQIEPIFRFVPSGTEESMITGTFVATGYVPSFLRTLAERGEAKLDLSVFDA